MANTLPGTPYVESSDLVANYPAVSESLAERIDEVGVLPFADSTARGTALPTPTEGQYTYLQDTNATEYWDGAAWVAAGVAPGLVHINTTTFSAVSSISLNNVFTSTYDIYELSFRVNDFASGQQLQYRYRVGGADNTGSNYTHKGIAGGANTANINVDNANIGRLTNSEGPGFYTFRIHAVALAEATAAVSSGMTDNNARAIVMGHRHSAATAFDGISFIASTGTFTGMVRVYGYKNS